MPKPTNEHLTRREREIMNALFALGNRASAEDIRTRLINPPSDSSVRVMLARLERKGYLNTSSTAFAISTRLPSLQQFLQTFFGGSQRQMMTAPCEEMVAPTCGALLDGIYRA